MVDPAQIRSYTDFQGLNQLKSQAGKDPAQALKTVASQFETQFVKMMLQSMREATPRDGLFNSDQMKTFEGMFDQEIAQKLSSRAGGIGLAEMIERQLAKTTSEAKPTPEGGYPLERQAEGMTTASEARAYPLPDASEWTLRPHAWMKQEDGKDAAKAEGDKLEQAGPTKERLAAIQSAGQSAPSEPTSRQPAYWESPEQFVEAILPHAREAADKLGVSPKVLVAQSALETGWGKHVPHDDSGRASHNFFGIKADRGWDGERQVHGTLEFESGSLVRRQAAFREYDSMAGSFNDFARFIQDNPRYGKALEARNDPEQFARELQQAGYATDPKYADKLISIMNSPALKDVV
ncbi:flagellar assembly peptidoglycan hydrolase FlgJ [Guyparkeria hydrothermalis]|uniref:flagellar assembly peptidoglycan hydrolase FlgJ n=1 Tax=Guyparkeria hydrothermalis TaxID=923 RepID=UPI00201FF025|nr:flagellar assembly peptidoglycan hydrolase FlgJ [Guyparkeria hydrothermalis]MCL7743443.1 flagellar assembly peptidoglycan hydrolase FlgJ [Guyparkeria hydrothermalis]